MILGAIAAVVASGGAAPAWLIPVLLVLLVVPAVFTLKGRQVGGTLRTREERSTKRNRSGADRSIARVEPRPQESVHPPARSVTVRNHLSPTKADWAVVDDVCAALGNRQIEWLRSNDFLAPWLGSRMRSALDLEPSLTGLATSPLPDELRASVLALVDAIEELSRYHTEETRPDPLVPGEEWRFFSWEDLGSSDSSEMWHARSAQLRRLSVAVADAYEDLVAVARNTQNRGDAKRVRA